MKVTPEKKAAFCAALATSGGNVSRACEAIEITRMTAYRWRQEDQDFAASWDEAKAIGLDALEDEVLRRAYEGVAEPVFYQGDECGTIRKYSDTLAIFLLKGGKPEKYADRSKTELSGSLALNQMTDDEIRAELAALAVGGVLGAADGDVSDLV